MHYKIVNEHGYIVKIGESECPPSGCEVFLNDIDEETGLEIPGTGRAKYDALMETIKSKPADTLEHIYRLAAAAGAYEPVTRTHAETVAWCASKVRSGKMAIEEVPEACAAEVQAIFEEN